MKEVVLTPDLAERILQLYEEMERAYAQVAEQLDFSCDGCPDNCCDSWFQHWEGFRQLPPTKQEEILERSRHYVVVSDQALAKNERPQVMCPLNEKGRCVLYTHRLMVCRTHGVPATMQRPDGQRLDFPGCFCCQEVVRRTNNDSDMSQVPRMERTLLLRELVKLENELMDGKRHLYPRLKLTIAQMLVAGPPKITTPYCER